MKLYSAAVLIFWWTSTLAPALPEKGATVVILGGVHYEPIRSYGSVQDCEAAQREKEKVHREDVIVLSVCATDGTTVMYRGTQNKE